MSGKEWEPTIISEYDNVTCKLRMRIAPSLDTAFSYDVAAVRTDGQEEYEDRCLNVRERLEFCVLSLSHTYTQTQTSKHLFCLCFHINNLFMKPSKNTGLYFPFNLRLKASGAWQVRGKHEVHCEISGIPTDTPREYQIMVSNPLHMWRYTAGLSITGRTDPYE